MIFLQKIVACLLAATLLSLPAVADETTDLNAFKAKITQTLATVNPRFRIKAVTPSGIDGFYKVQISNGPILYVAASAEFFFDGDLFDITDKRFINLTELDATADRKKLMSQLNPAEMIIFSPKKPVQTKAVINVFTDVDCFYCQKLHKEVPELNARGIEVRYLAFPRAGINTPSYDKIATAWCVDNKQETLTKLKNREAVAVVKCDNPVAKQYKLGKEMGVTGTPAIVLESGEIIPGYRPAAKLAKQLGI